MANPDVNLTPIKTEALLWDDEHRYESLLAVFKRSETHADNAISWYLNAKSAKKKWAQRMRVGVILLTALAGLLPMIAHLNLSFGSLRVEIDPIWATVALGTAALLIAFDRFFGCSTSWMRFITTEHHLRQLLHEFQMDFEAAHASWSGKVPTEEQVQASIGRCKTFLLQVDDVVRSETDQWLAEFQDAIKWVDETARSKSLIGEVSAINVTVTNRNELDASWTATIDGSPARTVLGNSIAFTQLLPGIHSVHIAAVKGGQSVSADRSIKVSAGEIADVQVAL